MELKLNIPCFVNKRDVVIRKETKITTKKNAVNHLLLGDYVRCTGKVKNSWVEVDSRKTVGWLKKEWLTNDRLLEVNFVDIGQGDGCHIVTPDDEVILLDAGEGIGIDSKGGDNMARFINWRYNLRNRVVAGVDGATNSSEKVLEPFEIDYAICSHPDLDHYYGFLNIFSNKKLKILNICHNGIVERPPNGTDSSTWFEDLGRKAPPNAKRKFHLWDTVRTNKDMHDLIKKNPTTRKFYLKTLRQARDNNKKVRFNFLNMSKKFLDHFKNPDTLQLKILAPITEKVDFNGELKDCLPKLGNEGVTKNGHSIVLMLKYKKLKILLGGDLNSNSQDYLAQKYTQINEKMSTLEGNIRKIEEDLAGELQETTRKDLEQELDESKKLLDLIITKTRSHFQCDIAKACHHGATDVLDSFLHAINPIATVISSGDNESHSHPRPDALGAFGKASRGTRPLIFSTELARSTNEFSYPIRFYETLKKMEGELNNLTAKKDKEAKILEMENMRDRNVAKYGMITVRTDGERVVVAQKLEEERSPGQKWDIYDLVWNKKLQKFEYDPDPNVH